MNREQRLSSLQVGRGVAAVLVLLFHTAGNLARPKYFGAAADPLERLCYFGGQAGVAFFFVLSGFIIHHVNQHRIAGGDWLDYLRRRAMRLYPTYLVLFACVYLPALAVPSISGHMPTDAATLLRSLLLLPQDRAVVGGTGAPVLVAAWSLQYEVYFYVLFAVAFVSRLLWRAVAAIVVGGIAATAAAGVTDFPAGFVFNPLVLLFFIGVAVSVACRSAWVPPRPRLGVAIGLAALAATGAAADVVREAAPHALFDALYGLCSAVVILCLVHAQRQGRLRWADGGLAVRLGEASYALYLMHFPVVSVLSKVAVLVLPAGVAGASIAFGAIVVACCALALVFHRRIEQPMIAAVDRLTHPTGHRRMTAAPE